MNEQEEAFIKKLELATSNAEIENQKLRKDYGQVNSMFATDPTGNLIQWQLDLNDEIERIHHLLRGNIIKVDPKGNEFWAESDDDEMKPFNDLGVQLILNLISFYLNRNTILSNYKEDMINWKMKDLGDELADLIFMKYNEMGMNTEGKRKLFPMIHREIMDTVHSAYLRALHGGERDSLRTARHVSQSDTGGVKPMTMPTPPTKFSAVKPSTWVPK